MEELKKQIILKESQRSLVDNVIAQEASLQIHLYLADLINQLETESVKTRVFINDVQKFLNKKEIRRITD